MGGPDRVDHPEEVLNAGAVKNTTLAMNAQRLLITDQIFAGRLGGGKYALGRELVNYVIAPALYDLPADRSGRDVRLLFLFSTRQQIAAYYCLLSIAPSQRTHEAAS